MTEKSKKILVVEDEWKIGRFLQMELGHEGYLTEVEANGRIALGQDRTGGF